MKSSPLFLLLLAFVLLFPLCQSTDAQEKKPKGKKVFGLVVLGEPLTDVKKRLGAPDFKGSDVMGWDDKGPGKILIVYAFDGAVAGVIANYGRGSWLKLGQVEQILMRKYGEPENHDYFPSYANTDSSKDTAISLGKGRVMRVWDRGVFAIRLGWGKIGLGLAYQHKELWKRRRKKRDEKY